MCYNRPPFFLPAPLWKCCWVFEAELKTVVGPEYKKGCPANMDVHTVELSCIDYVLVVCLVCFEKSLCLSEL